MKWRLWSNKHRGWWRPHSLGYTSNVDEAGEFGTVTAMTVLMRACDDLEWWSTHDEPKTLAVHVESGETYFLIDGTPINDGGGGTPLSVVEDAA